MAVMKRFLCQLPLTLYDNKKNNMKTSSVGNSEQIYPTVEDTVKKPRKKGVGTWLRHN